MKKSNRWTSLVCFGLSSFGASALIVACSGEATEQGGEDAVIEQVSDDLAILRAADGSASPQVDEGVPGDDSAGSSQGRALDCAYVQWCDAPSWWGSRNWGTVCRVRNGCDFGVGFDECFKDVKAVCGGWVYPAAIARDGVQL